ncbi:ester cyclase [Patescibacteria group bacterium]|nr:ester cyclase [Patescibacteria group bacterium]
MIKKYIAKDYVAYGMRNKITVNGILGVEQNIKKLLEKYPDFVVIVEDMIDNGNKVVSRLIFKPSEDSDISMREIILHEIKDDKIHRAWSIGSDWN